MGGGVGHFRVREQFRPARRGCLAVENRLRLLRAERNWSQQDLGERLEVSRQSINAIETGKYDPSLPLAFRISELFDLPIEDIFVSPSRRSSKAI
jgi:putative transcriptional regulator